MSTAVVFLDSENASVTTWHTGLLYKLAELELSVNLIKLTRSFLSRRKFRISVEGEFSTPRYMEAGVPQGSVPSPTPYTLYDTPLPKAIDVHFALFEDDTRLYATDGKEGYILRKLQGGLDSMVTWCERWNVRSMKTRLGRSTSPIRGVPPWVLTLNGRNIPFVNTVKYRGVIFDKKVTWSLHMERIEATAFRTLIDYIPFSKVSDWTLTLNWPSWKHSFGHKLTYWN
jgi:hypothetical protein